MVMMPKKIRKQKPRKKKKNAKYGWQVTLALVVLICLIVSLFWSIFVSGPSRIHDAQLAKTEQTIEKAVPGIKGLEKNDFEYVTWQGYTEDTLYWFDNSGKEITTRPIEALDYDKVRENAKNDYSIDPTQVTLAYGYDSPVYLIKGSGKMLMLDFDTLERVYEREDRQ